LISAASPFPVFETIFENLADVLNFERAIAENLPDERRYLLNWFFDGKDKVYLHIHCFGKRHETSN
jgi:hypothetical protein